MYYEKIFSGEDLLIHTGSAPEKPGKVLRAVYHIPGSRIRFLRFGLNMPSDEVYFGVLSAEDTGKKIVSNSLLMLKTEESPRMLLLGFSRYDYSDGTFILSVDPSGGFQVEILADYDDLTLEEGSSVGTDPILELCGDDYNALLREWAQCVARHTGKRIPEKIPCGWNDWQYYRNEKTQEDILENCEELLELKKQGVPCDFIQIDGGYCLHLSEWDTPSERFSMGIGELSRRIRSMGFRFGIWFAPYIQNIHTKVVREHPEWFLRDDKGELVRLGNSNVGESLLMDYTVEGTVPFLREKIRFLQEEWKVEWIKLDGPNIAAYRRGVLADKKVTVQQMLRKTLSIIAGEAGNILVEGEGSMTAAAGLVDLHRVQADNHPLWKVGETLYAPTVYGKELLMSFLHRIWWCNHRENIVLRNFQSPHSFLRKKDPPEEEILFTENECRIQLASAVIAPGGFLLTDPVKRMKKECPDRLKNLNLFSPLPDGCTEVLDPFPEDGSRYASMYKRVNGTEVLYALLNFSDREKSFTLPPLESGFCRSLFTGENVPETVTLPPHGAELLRWIRP